LPRKSGEQASPTSFLKETKYPLVQNSLMPCCSSMPANRTSTSPARTGWQKIWGVDYAVSCGKSPNLKRLVSPLSNAEGKVVPTSKSSISKPYAGRNINASPRLMCHIGTSRNATLAPLEMPSWHLNNIQRITISQLRYSISINQFILQG